MKSGNEVNLVTLSSYTCMSKTELEWLRKHSLFGLMFFDKISVAISEDVKKGIVLTKIETEVGNIPEVQVKTRVQAFMDTIFVC